MSWSRKIKITKEKIPNNRITEQKYSSILLSPNFFKKIYIFFKLIWNILENLRYIQKIKNLNIFEVYIFQNEDDIIKKILEIKFIKTYIISNSSDLS